MSLYKEIFYNIRDKGEKEQLDEMSFEYTKPIIKELEGIIKKLKKGTYHFSEVIDLKKKISELKELLK